jgi:hypothetical protein
MEWSTILVKTGMYTGGEPSWAPTAIYKDVYEAVQWALEKEGWESGLMQTASSGGGYRGL